MSQSSMMATAQASLLKCEATLNALQTAFSQARSELAEVRRALDITARSLEQDSLGTSSSGHIGSTALEEITNGMSALQAIKSFGVPSDKERKTQPTSISARSPFLDSLTTHSSSQEADMDYPRSSWALAEMKASSATTLHSKSVARPIPSVSRSATWEVQDSLELSRSTGDIWSWGPDTLGSFNTMSTRPESRSTVSTANYLEDWEALWDVGQAPSTLQESVTERPAEDWSPVSSEDLSPSFPLSSANSWETSMSDGNIPVIFPREVDISSQSEAAGASYAAMCSRVPRPADLARDLLCPKCRQPASQCQDGRSLRKVGQETIGNIIKTAGPSWPKSKLGRLAMVIGAGKNGANVLLRWGADSKVESFTITAKNIPKFSLVCPGTGTGISFSEKEGGMETAVCVVRLPVRPFIREVWAHDDLGEKHRLIISADRNFRLVAVGLLVETTITKIVVSICQKNDHCDEHNSIFSQNFSKVQSNPKATTVLKLDKKVLLKGGEPHLLVLNIFGGSSLVGCGGEETLELGITGTRKIQLRLEDFRHRDNVCSKTTNVERGIIEKFYIEN